jgi:hypothetical protein
MVGRGSGSEKLLRGRPCGGCDLKEHQDELTEQHDTRELPQAST